MDQHAAQCPWQKGHPKKVAESKARLPFGKSSAAAFSLCSNVGVQRESYRAVQHGGLEKS